MYKILAWLIFLLPAVCHAQIRTSLYSGGNVPQDLILYDDAGQPILFNDHSSIAGTPYLQNEWKFGRIELSNGTFLSDSSINFSLYSNQLYFKREGMIYPVSYPMKEFSILMSNDSSHKNQYHFQNSFPEIGRNTTATFYEVLYAGKSLQLLKWSHKKVMEIYKYNEAIQNQYLTVQEFFIFYPAANKMISLGSKIRLNMIKIKLPDYANQIDKYRSLHTSGMSKEKDLTQLISFLDDSGQ